MLKTQASAGPFFTGLNHVVNHVVNVAKTHYTVLEQHSHGLFSLDSQYSRQQLFEEIDVRGPSFTTRAEVKADSSWASPR